MNQGLLCWVFGLLAPCLATAAELLLVEAENFDEPGGWVVDQQFMEQMGSPYLLAHGLGEPVRDARTTVRFAAPGRYHVWVRTRDWVAPFKAAGAPGRFQVLLGGKALESTFGTEGAEWHWQDGGIAEAMAETTVSLHDLTGFDGRCDAVLFGRNLDFRPPDSPAELANLRRELLGWSPEPETAGQFDLVVVGGGIAGTCAAVSAARLGLTVALVQDRPLLGGNGSSEVRVWPEGAINQQPFPHIGDVVAELVPAKTSQAGNARTAEFYADERKLAVARAEPRLRLFLEQRVNQVRIVKGRIQAVLAQHTRTARRIRIAGRLFADCTGDGALGYLAGADHEVTREQHMGGSNLWRADVVPDPAPFPRCPWAVDLEKKPFPGRPFTKATGSSQLHPDLGNWMWESGFDRDPIAETEWMRDLNLRAMYGAWDALKNVDRLYPNHKLSWAAYIMGKRESRRLLGDVVLSADDFRTNKAYPDACFPCSWHIDLHSPHPDFQKGNEGEEFISTYTRGEEYSYKTPYWAPYRVLYSRNLPNLFMAGRDISVTHEALGAVRVMRTCGTMGEIVGMASALCKKHECSPREIYEAHLNDLKGLMARGTGPPASEAGIKRTE
jgi:hypothetical protein